MAHKTRKGFTLVELIAILAILGIISAIAVPTAFSSLDSSKKDADLYTMRTIQAEETLYFLDNNVHTFDDSGTTAPVEPTLEALRSMIGDVKFVYYDTVQWVKEGANTWKLNGTHGDETGENGGSGQSGDTSMPGEDLFLENFTVASPISAISVYIVNSRLPSMIASPEIEGNCLRLYFAYDPSYQWSSQIHVSGIVFAPIKSYQVGYNYDAWTFAYDSLVSGHTASSIFATATLPYPSGGNVAFAVDVTGVKPLSSPVKDERITFRYLLTHMTNPLAPKCEFYVQICVDFNGDGVFNG